MGVRFDPVLGELLGKYVKTSGDTMTGDLTINGIVKVGATSGVESFQLLDGTTKKATIKYVGNTTTLDIPSVEPTNKVTNPTFDTDLTNWTASVPTSVTDLVMGEYELVPGDATFGTDDFYVMKYEAKAWDTQTDAVIADGGYGSGAGWAGSNSQTRYQARSIADGRPWVYIAQNHPTNFDAQEACSALGSGYHLINNNEWMTIARNAAQIDSNWTNGQVGDGAVFRGNSNSSASLDGSDPLTGINTRTHTLSNGSIVWDMAGNVWNWTDDIQSTAINTAGGWVEWNHANVEAGAIDTYGPPDGYLSAQGMGQIYGGSLNNAFLRGGSWGYGADAGLFTLSLYPDPTFQYSDIGFRCASDPVAISQSLDSTIKYAGSNSVKLVTSGNIFGATYLQTINVGDTNTYNFIAYAYTDGTAVTDADLELYYNGATISTTYTSMGGGWYRLSGSLTGANENRDYGFKIENGVTVYIDSVSIQSGLGSTTTFSVKNSGTGNMHHEWEGTGTFNAGIGTEQAAIFKGATSQTADLLQIQNSAGTVLDVIDSDGNVGIGTSSPGRLLEVSGSDNNARIRLNSTDTTAGQYSGFEIFGSGSFKGGLFVQNSAKDVVQIWDNSAAVINLKSGNVGIGTTSPATKLDVAGVITAQDKIIFTQTDGNEYIDSLADGYMDYGATTAHRFDNPLILSNVKTGATQAGAGAAAGEVWATSSHASLPDNVLMLGV